MRPFALVLTALALPLSGVVAANAPPITGHTSANSKSVDGIRKILGVTALCASPNSIGAENVPEEFDPKSAPRYPSSLGPTPRDPIRYEYWMVEGCGRHAKFLIQLWYDTNGEELYAASPPQGWLTVHVRISAENCSIGKFEVACSDVGAKLRELGTPSEAHIDVIGDTHASYSATSAALESIRSAGFRLKIGYITSQ